MAGGRADGWARGQAGELTGSERLMGGRAVEWSGIKADWRAAGGQMDRRALWREGSGRAGEHTDERMDEQTNGRTN